MNDHVTITTAQYVEEYRRIKTVTTATEKYMSESDSQLIKALVNDDVDGQIDIDYEGSYTVGTNKFAEFTVNVHFYGNVDEVEAHDESILNGRVENDQNEWETSTTFESTLDDVFTKNGYDNESISDYGIDGEGLYGCTEHEQCTQARVSVWIMFK